jgi:hypothetical protein
MEAVSDSKIHLSMSVATALAGLGRVDAFVVQPSQGKACLRAHADRIDGHHFIIKAQKDS